jgi:hypothetical protein
MAKELEGTDGPYATGKTRSSETDSVRHLPCAPACALGVGCPNRMLGMSWCSAGDETGGPPSRPGLAPCDPQGKSLRLILDFWSPDESWQRRSASGAGAAPSAEPWRSARLDTPRWKRPVCGRAPPSPACLTARRRATGHGGTPSSAGRRAQIGSAWRTRAPRLKNRLAEYTRTCRLWSRSNRARCSSVRRSTASASRGGAAAARRGVNRRCE